MGIPHGPYPSALEPAEPDVGGMGSNAQQVASLPESIQGFLYAVKKLDVIGLPTRPQDIAHNAVASVGAGTGG